ncbi:hypothetical protein R1flu_002289 [Riccia fluitans]|uniref:Dirigent protein n=1 Tax=Riccia fluitans TaxID=41844 RepID=A0ABD1Y9J1_9MARC
MVTQKSASYASPIVLILAFALLCSLSTVRSDRERDPSLVIYLFEQFFDVPGANSTDIIAVPPGGSLASATFGYLGVAEFPVRASSDPTAPVIGKSPGFFFPNKEPLNLSIFKLITLDTEQYKGTLFSASDFKVLRNLTSETELTVSGGTGSFRDASGYITVTAVDIGPDHATYKYAVYLSTCRRTPLMFH